MPLKAKTDRSPIPVIHTRDSVQLLLKPDSIFTASLTIKMSRKIMRTLRLKKPEHPKEVTNKYEIGRHLGKGAFGVVKQCKVRCDC